MPRTPIAFIAVLFAVALLAASATTGSAPMYTSLGTVRAEAAQIVIGKVQNDSSGLVVDVEKSLRGGVPPGPLAVTESPDGHVMVGPERLVAFIDRKGALRWVGRLMAGSTLERGVIRLEGFYDFGAHVVSPSVMTLYQLERYLHNGRLAQVFDVQLAFPDGKGGLTPSSLHLRVVYDVVTHQATWKGLHLACFTGPAAMLSVDWGRFALQLTGQCADPNGRTHSRHLAFEGRVTAANLGAGTLQVLAFPERPFMTESEFRRYALDGTITDLRRKVEVTLSDGEKYTWLVGSKLVSSAGREYPAGGVQVASRAQARGSGAITVSQSRFGFGRLQLVLSPAPDQVTPGGDAASIVKWLDSPSQKGCRLVGPDAKDRSCTLSHLPPEVVKASFPAPP